MSRLEEKPPSQLVISYETEVADDIMGMQIRPDAPVDDKMLRRTNH